MPRTSFRVPGEINSNDLTVATTTLTVDETNNRIGIATASPAYTLDVSGIIRGSSGVIGLTTTGAPSVTIADGAFAVDTTNHTFYFRSGSTWRLLGPVTSLTGTANQVIVSAATGAITLSLPQNIHTAATPTFAALTVSNNITFPTAGDFGLQNTGTGSTLACFYVEKAGGNSQWKTRASYIAFIDSDTTTFRLSGGGTTIGTFTSSGLTLNGDLAVNGLDITTTGTGTATVFNANALTVNIGGAATAINMGAATGTTTINNNLTVTGTSTLFPTDASNVVLGASATTGNRLRFHRSGANVFADFTGTLTIRPYNGSNVEQRNVVITNDGGIRHNYTGLISHNTTQSIPDVTYTAILFNTDKHDYADSHNVTTNTSRVTIPIAGVWQFWAQVPLADSVNGRREMEIRQYNSAGTLLEYWRTGVDAGDGGTNLVTTLTASFACAATDYVQLWYYHNSGAARNTVSGLGLAPQMGWTLLRAN